MEFVASIVDTVFRPLKDYFARTYGYVMSCGEYIDELGHRMNELKSKRDDVKRMVDAAERQGMEATSQVKWWLECVAALEDAAVRIDEEYRARLQLPPDQAPGVKATYHLSKKADETLAEAASLKEKGDFHKVADELVQVRFEEMPSAPIVGRDALLLELHAFVRDGDVGIVGIYGMAGVGKTALLNKFNNEFLVNSCDINVAIYIEVGKEVNLDDIQRIIGDRLGVSWENKTPRERAGVLYRVLSKMNFVLLLDDVWEPLNFRMLGIPVPKQNSKSKIVLTTRIEDVCDRMDVRRKLKMECLPWEPAWELFREKVGEHLMSSSPEIRHLAQALAMKCGGLPLALITVGRAMASKRTAKEWKHAITVVKIAPWQLLGMELDVLEPLKKSYDNLPSDKLRLCLLYCSLFPEEFSISKDWIIGYCIGEGFIDDLYTEMDEIYNKGHDLLGDLKIASLLEKGEDEDHIKMHPMARAMALWIASEFGTKETKWLVRAGVRLKEAPGAEKWNDAERISFMRNNILELYERPNCPLLKTLILQGNPGLDKICDGFFQFMPSLRVLDLSYTSISELPSGIGSLVELQYLDLYNTNIRSLPRELGSLVTLRFLLLSNMPLEMIPGGVICSLTMLQVLYMDLSYGDWKVGASGNGVDFQELESLRRLKALDITIQSPEALERLSRSHRVAGSTRNLLIKTCSSLTKIQLPSGNLWKNMTGLKRVWIASCSNLAEVIIDGSKETDRINALPQAILQGRADLVDDEQPILPSLHNVILQGLQKVKIIYKGGCVQNLASLFIWYCHGLEELITLSDEEQEVTASSGEQTAGTFRVITPFPNLKELYLHGLAKFRRLSSSTCTLRFPSLESLKIVECPNLKKLKLSAGGLNVIQCTREWWDGLEWDDEEVKASYEPLFCPMR
ncbi:disease resistance protein RPS2-like [Phragmites australis]|uniref:disease resistance protein RPS2-like n=1 Tax=Phragmites australis TaxID=29695 RepID=UPI002D765C0A|nr:disease resistance protein RPS2-like [Phragmites australis]